MCDDALIPIMAKRHFKVGVGEHLSIPPLTNKLCKSKKSAAVKGHMLMCNKLVSFDSFKVKVKPLSLYLF